MGGGGGGNVPCSQLNETLHIVSVAILLLFQIQRIAASLVCLYWWSFWGYVAFIFIFSNEVCIRRWLAT